MTKEMPETDWREIRQVVGVDFGINFLGTAYDSQGQTIRCNVGRHPPPGGV